MIRNILLVFLLITSIVTTAQRTSSSPYSFFGIGDQNSPVTVEQSGMGGIGVAFSHYKYLNFTNPAAYADLRYTTYSFGVLNTSLSVDNGITQQNSNSTSLSYFALALPIGSKAGFSFGIQPVSSVGYSLLNNTEVTRESFKGEGGVSMVYGSFGMKLFKGLSLGIEADYSFGRIENNITTAIIESSLLSIYQENLNVTGGSVTFGAQYKKELKNKLVVNGGATLKLSNDLNVKGDETLSSSNPLGVGKDLLFQTDVSGSYNMPLKTTFGAGLGKLDKWYFGLEYENQDAIETTNLVNATSNAAYIYGDSNRFSLGGFYLPKINSISSYWQRVTYRAGVRIEKTGLLVDGSIPYTNYTSINDFGISFGLGLPLKQLSSINMGFEFGKRGAVTNNLIEENYFNFRLSLSLTDTNWFQKRKID
ncbi:hypothetical protein [uncultured Polaribacter sp.]|uniref:hypothetical protein n=1 Tax=uncultured Polaribacter sp. TaxID=174711 RepID=UPI00261457E2|nr:hypothetical protein [uncultured Polaribacter sp.]